MKYAVLDMKKYSYILILCGFIGFSQTKNEKEFRINESAFPTEARGHFNIILDSINYIKYYKETDGEKHSFEIKFKYKKQHYSVEFDTLGNLEDIEILIKKKHLPKEVWHNIQDYFSKNYKTYSLVKLQKQYRNTSQKTDRQFIHQILNKPINKHTHFEIISEIKTKHLHELREFTFDRNGTFETSRKVTSSSYEHALY